MLFEVHMLQRLSTTIVFVYVGIINLFCHISFSLVFFVLPISRCIYKRFLVLGLPETTILHANIATVLLVKSVDVIIFNHYFLPELDGYAEAFKLLIVIVL